MSDLRSARSYIMADPRPQNGDEKRHEIDEITAAIREIRKAAIDDGKDENYNTPTDSVGMASGPLHEAVRLLRKAHEDCSGGADLPNAIGMKLRALHHIDEARDTLIRFIHESGM